MGGDRAAVLGSREPKSRGGSESSPESASERGDGGDGNLLPLPSNARAIPATPPATSSNRVATFSIRSSSCRQRETREGCVASEIGGLSMRRSSSRTERGWWEEGLVGVEWRERREGRASGGNVVELTARRS